ncbi:cytochrome P450 [Stereum hirsutum FP-91666 SS1]|uniref:cytochrome P450 n=1 Tax=Stereum hirsutum (strain FP-91666) TaxID=721885 RepID=UPI000444A51B|nr:cytochrome P450 [Stereum hirsutum FP-91666 SS1]EIM83701.1 cytochrome P450 [Stereum hirsutum FP-91666 SS1]
MIFVDFARQNPALLLTLLVSFSVYSLVHHYRSPLRKVPPGPRGWPLIGNALDLGGPQLWLKLTEWRETYGDIIYLNAAGQPVVILNSPKAAAGLLDKRAGNTSNRPRNIVGSEMLTGGLFMPLKSPSDVWRRMRHATHEELSKSSSTAYQPSQMAESVSLALDLLRSPSQWLLNIQRANGAFIINLLFGSNPDTSDIDTRIAAINDFTKRLTIALLPGSHLVEFFPWMKYIPARFAEWKRAALNSFKTDSVTFERMTAPVYAGLARGEEPSSLLGRISKDPGRYNLSLGESSWIAVAMYAAGAETTTSIMAWWMQAMVLHPDAQVRAQAELDAVVGRARVPTFTDYEHLPYIRAMAKEALRWRPVVPLGVPHASRADDYYEGHFIPANSLIIANVWLLNRDPGVWGPDAMEFKPERHLDDHEKRVGPQEAKEEGHFTYGFGRRVCVGKHVANVRITPVVLTISSGGLIRFGVMRCRIHCLSRWR